MSLNTTLGLETDTAISELEIKHEDLLPKSMDGLNFSQEKFIEFDGRLVKVRVAGKVFLQDQGEADERYKRNLDRGL